MDETELAALRDPVRVAQAIAHWAETRWAAPVTVQSATPLTGGLDNFVHALRLAGTALPTEWQQELVVRIAPSAERFTHAAREMAIQNWISQHHYPAPRVLVLLHDDWELNLPAQISARAPGVQLLDAIKAQPRRAKELMAMLAGLHVDLHRLDQAGWPEPKAIGTAAIKRTALIHERIDAGNVTLGVAMRQVEVGLEWCATNPVDTVVCHGDFHPLNVVFDAASGAAMVVDWTDVTVDDPHSDIARTAVLFRCAAIAGSSGVERVALRLIGPILARMYLKAYRQRRAFDPERLRHWEALHLLNGLAQIDSLTDPAIESSAAGQTFPKWVVRSIERRLQQVFRAT